MRQCAGHGDARAGKYVVPVLWDKQKKTIVNNESADIILMLNDAFNDVAKKPDLDLNPEALRGEIEAVNEWIYPTINNGVYRCGFAQQQAPYEEAFRELFASLDRVEGILAKQRYLAGDKLTLADVRLFMTLIRFDTVRCRCQSLCLCRPNVESSRDAPSCDVCSNVSRQLSSAAWR